MTPPLAAWSRRLQARIRRIPARIRLGVVVGMIALAGLAWQHHAHTDSAMNTAPPQPPARVAPSTGDYGDDPAQLQLPAPTLSPQAASLDAARIVAQRFAANFAAPNNNRDDWLTRIGGDVSAQLREQYQLTDIRNVTQASVTAVEGPLDQLPAAVAFRAEYSDGSQVQLHLELQADGWKIVNVVPIPLNSQAAPEAP
jgi:hypothetical protein